MLEELYIRNYALIEDLTVHFSGGFNVLTGETGAGKTILAGALGLLMGGKGGSNRVKPGCGEAIIVGKIRTESPEVADWLVDHGLTLEEGSLLLQRTIKATGHNRISVQSVPQNLQALSDITTFLFDLHSQHDHQSLFSKANHRRLLDRHAQIVGEVEEFSREFNQLLALRAERHSLREEGEKLRRERGYLEFAVEEIHSARLKVGEDQELLARIRRVENRQQLYSQSLTLKALLAESSLEALAKAQEAVKKLQAIDPDRYASHGKRLENLFYEISDLAESVESYSDDPDQDLRDRQESEERLSAIGRLERKYGGSIEAVLDFAAKSSEKLTRASHHDQRIESLTSQIKKIEGSLTQRASTLSQRRQEAAQTLEKAIQGSLVDLGMAEVRFSVQCQSLRTGDGKLSYDAYGTDDIEFLFAPGPNLPSRPLRQIASGGEISRIMLALKSHLSHLDNLETLVFDEIDVGVGGQMGVKIGQYFKKISREKQVLVITHLASIAALADHHIRVEKVMEGQSIRIMAREVKDSEREQEIARMLSGDSKGEISISHAKEILTGREES